MQFNKVVIACSSLYLAQDIERKISIHNPVKVSISQNDKELRIELENSKPALILIEDSFYKGITAYIIGTLRDKYPDIRFAVFTFREMELDELENFYTIAAASAFINFRLSRDEYVKGINQVVAGNDYMPDFILEKFPYKQTSPLKKIKLTKREIKVILLLAEGHKPPRIASDLKIAEGTVRKHKNNIYAKCGVHSRIELMKFVKDLKRQNKYGGSVKE